MASGTVRSGGCHCGATRFEAEGAPKLVGNCYCNDCRRATGAAFSTYVGYRDDQVRWSGAPREIYRSSSEARRGFCRKCGTPLSYQGDKWSGETHLFIGTFGEPGDLTPTGDVFSEEALAWCAVGKPAAP